MKTNNCTKSSEQLFNKSNIINKLTNICIENYKKLRVTLKVWANKTLFFSKDFGRLSYLSINWMESWDQFALSCSRWMDKRTESNLSIKILYRNYKLTNLKCLNFNPTCSRYKTRETKLKHKSNLRSYFK